ncbi:MAG: Holliday junction branch migration protein RuvA [Clostridia bacterium]|nr:Holliday junction branch migration protein RuvA [Clostridia bacterium]
MFYHIAGKFVHKEESFAVLDCSGVGYRLTISMNTSDALGYADGERTVKLYTYLQVREDDIELFGFYTEDELAAFRLLISASGVGPKAAMAILSLLTPEKLALAVASEDIKAISRANGVGAKTAARVVLELKDKFKGISAPSSATSLSSTGTAAAPSGGKLGEALEALTVLGYGRAEVTEALRKLDTASLSVEQIITAALKYFAK